MATPDAPPQVIIVAIEEIGSLDPFNWTAKLSCEGYESTREIRIQDPLPSLGNLTEESFRWILEDHPERFPYDQSTAGPIATAIREYGIDLWKQLSLSNFLAELGLDSEAPPAVVIDVCDHGPQSLFQRLHWETLEQAGASLNWIVVLRRAILDGIKSSKFLADESLIASMERLGVREHTTNQNLHPAQPAMENPMRDHNILLVVARPSKEEDINPLLGARAIFSALESLAAVSSVKVNVEIARPGTWDALVNHLESRTKAWHAQGGKGGWFDAVHFDVHGVVRNDVASLLFLSNKGTHALKRPAEMIGTLLKENHVRFAVLNSCDSAKVSTSYFSNLARTFVGLGLEAVVAMAFKVTSSAAKIFLRAFYHGLFVENDLDMLGAIQAGRDSLALYPERVGRLNIIVDLPDYFVPVLYGAGKTTARDIIVGDSTAAGEETGDVEELGEQEVGELDEEEVEDLKEQEKELLKEQDVKEDIDLERTDEPKASLVGREQDILELEWYLLRSRNSNIVRLTGMVGVGKTALVEFLGDWWHQSGMVSSVLYHDLRKTKISDTIAYLEERHEFLSGQDGNRHLLILDHLDTLMRPANDNFIPMIESERKRLTVLIRNHLGKRDLMILVSRSEENWFDIPKRQHYKLGGLTSYHAATLASQIITEIGMAEILEDEVHVDYIENLICRLSYNPICLKIFLGAMKTSRAHFRAQGLSDAEMDKLGQMPDTPKDLFTILIRAIIVVSPDVDPTWQECDDFFRWIWDQSAPYGALSLLGLAPPVNAFREEWYEEVSKAISGNPYVPDLSTEDIGKFVSTYLDDSGWIEDFEMTWPDGSSTHYKRVHPLLTNAMRVMLVGPANHKPLMVSLWNAFPNHYSIWSMFESAESMTPRFRYQIQVESYNFLSCFDEFFEMLEQGADRPGLNIQAFILLDVLMKAAEGSKSRVLSPDFVLPRLLKMAEYAAFRLLNGYKDSLDGLEDNIGIMLRSYHWISSHYSQRDPKESGVYAEICLKVLMAACNGQESWRSEHRYFLSEILLNQGSSCLFYKDRAPEARQAFEMALRAFKRDDDSLGERRRSAKIRLGAYHGLIAAAQALKDFYDVEVDPAIITAYEAAHSKAVLDVSDEVHHRSATDTDSLTVQRKPSTQKPPQNPVAESFIRSTAVLEEAKKYTDEKDYQGAKDLLLTGVQSALLTNDRSAEYLYQTTLIDIAMDTKDYPAAASHIARATELKNLTSGGLFFLEKPVHRMFRATRYGSVMLRMGLLIPALRFFYDAQEARVGDNLPAFILPKLPAEFVRESMYLARLGLMMLSAIPMKIINAAEFNELDDMMQALLLKHLHQTWPDYDPDGSKTKASLERSFVANYDWDVDAIPEGMELATAGPSMLADVLGVPRVEGGELQRHESDMKALADPEREKGTGRGINDYEFDLAPLEEVVLFYRADPEGAFEGGLRHELIRGAKHT